MARVVMSEAGSQKEEQDMRLAVAETIINRVLDDDFPDTVQEVVYQKNQYSTSNNGEPTADCYQAVYSCLSKKQFAEDIIYFREDYYHSGSYAEDAFVVDNMYFSTKKED